MHPETFLSAVQSVLDGDIHGALPVLEANVARHPAWVTPIVALARSAEALQDWESAFELWTQARKISPRSPLIDEGVKRASINLFDKHRPAEETNTVTAFVSEKERASPTVDKPEPVDSEQSQQSVSTTSEPVPLVQPFDFDLTDMSSTPDTDSTAQPSSALADLDHLIDRLEGARIVPRDDAASIPSPDLDSDVDDVVSETLATIYLNQEQFGEAARVFEKLAHQHPDRKDEFLAKAREARQNDSN